MYLFGFCCYWLGLYRLVGGEKLLVFESVYFFLCLFNNVDTFKIVLFEYIYIFYYKV